MQIPRSRRQFLRELGISAASLPFLAGLPSLTGAPMPQKRQRLVIMFGADEVRVFGGHEIKFECRCSRERVASVLRSLGAEEVRSVIEEQGACTVTCEFCQKPYRFDAVDAEQLFAEGSTQGSSSIN